ncbi:uncharacterized protein HD556DRAFT_1006992 [Suillus plorans]|uniref:Uncharacterized protein n=1 Tax=Suillus plorans TaxID=116603 RepID=A0A9P7ADU4_9AGAM|nr:uncharacterized protein HD556DRAFT_1006992 [Suillus plorans]KAG1786815.1 hypothetical protein HD556DRAFT_1006992 [Suillus plorans]
MSSTRSQTSTSPQHSSTNNSNNNNQIMSDIFGANESPSLVVAFLAIGLFMVVMAALFGWKRMRRGRFVVQPARPVRVRVRPGRKPIAIGEKPTLWDMWTRRRDSEVTIDLKWENITPFCATRVFCRKEKPRRAVLMKATAVEPRNPPRSSFVMTRISAFREHFGVRLIRSPPPPAPPPPPEPQTHELDDMSERPEGSFVVMAFTISMPSPSTSSTRKRDNATSSEVSDRVSTLELLHDTELGEYCIGSVEVSCSEDR